MSKAKLPSNASDSTANAKPLPCVLTLAKSARALIHRLKQYELCAAQDKHLLSPKTLSAFSYAGLAALETEQELKRIGLGSTYPFQGEPDDTGPVIKTVWPSQDIFLAISSIREFLHKARRGEAGYADRAGGQWVLPPESQFGKTEVPDFSSWLDLLENAVTALEQAPNQTETPHISKPDRSILVALLKHFPTLQTIADICRELNETLSERSIGPILKKLIRAGLVIRPDGDRKGATLTPAGKDLAHKFAASS